MNLDGPESVCYWLATRMVSGSLEALNRREAVRLWQDVTHGRIAIRRYGDERGRRLLVLKLPSKAAQLVELSERERRAMGYRAFGWGFRRIADELGVATATVMADLAKVRRRLGVASDLDLPAILAAGLKSAAKPLSAKLRRHEIWREALRAPRGLRREPSRKAGEHSIISFPISDADWRQGLSRAEVSVAEDTLAGKGRSQIAARRGAAVRTVVNQLASVFRKLGVRSRLELSLYVMAGRYTVAQRRK